ncbi:hypothetical protein KFK09_025968 [Dendrobium nobile]|uniref:trehalose-phosphatase n=1 Tax=Dendrobium nobile TaxID=94219 RepID=A0A8T3A6F8_DENNO|nr:hypothetical protein KFK09_025968 [Dendrobium nobile]
MMDSRSFVPTKSLRTDGDDVDEGIADDQISSTAPSIEFNFKEFEDPLSKSSSLPIFDEPVYDVYDDDMFFEVLDVDTPVNNDDKSKPIQEVIAEKNNGGDECTVNINAMIPAFECIHDGWDATELKVENNKFCLSVHFRCVDDKRWRALADQVKSLLKEYPKLRLTPGRKVLEIHSIIKGDKGRAMEVLLKSL